MSVIINKNKIVGTPILSPSMIEPKHETKPETKPEIKNETKYVTNFFNQMAFHANAGRTKRIANFAVEI